MADFGSPVAKGFDAGEGLHTLGSLLSLKQQQGALVQQQQAIQGQAAQVQQEQLKTHEEQGVQDFFNSWDPSQHIAADGTTDTDSAHESDSYKNAGNAKPAIDAKLADVKAKQLNNKLSLASLNKETLGQLGQVTQSLANDPDVVADRTDPVTGVNAGRIKTREALQNFSQLSPDAARVANLYAPLLKGARQGHLSTGLKQIAMQGQDIAGQQAQTNPQTISADTGPSIKFGTVARDSGVPNFKNGPTLGKGLAPQVVTLPSGSLGVMGGAGGNSVPSGPPAAPTGPSDNKLQPLQRPGANAPRADQENYQNQIAQAGKDYSAVSQAATDPFNGVQATRFRNQQVRDLIPHATTGPGLKLLNTLASRLPNASGDAYQDLEHYTAQNSAAIAKLMGVPGTNLGQETAAAAAGNVERNPGALKEITNANDALNTGFDLYNRGLAKITANGSDMSKVNAYKQAFGQNLDVNALRWADAHRSGDVAEQNELRAKYGAKAIGQWTKSLKTLKSLADKGDLP